MSLSSLPVLNISRQHHCHLLSRFYVIGILCLSFIFILNVYQLILSPRIASPIPILFKSRLRSQTNSRQHFVKFRNLTALIHFCDNISTIDCLNYLHENQSDYLTKLSSEELQTFHEEYCSSKNKLLFHTFWDDSSRLNDTFLQLHIKSYLYTQNRQCSNMIIWTLPTFNKDDPVDRNYSIYEPYLQIRTLSLFIDDLHQVGIHIDMNSTESSSWRLSLPPLAIVSDAVRFVVLNKLGGIYVDADVLLLRDLQPLFLYEFAYRWSYTEEFNTAVLRLMPKSNTSSIIMNITHQNRSPYAFYPTTISSYKLSTSFLRLPCAFFDPLWLPADSNDSKATKIWKLPNNNTIATFTSVFERENEISRQGLTVFNGAFAFHWHALKRIHMFQNGSYLQQWDQFLTHELYNEFD